MRDRILLRVENGGIDGPGRLERTCAVAAEVRARGAEALLIVDDEPTARRLGETGFQTCSVLARPGWALLSARGAWLDGERVDWTEDLRRLARRGTPSLLVDNRTAAREWATTVVQPNLHVRPDPWESVHASRVLRGALWIPLPIGVRAWRSEARRDVDLLINLGEEDLECLTQRSLEALPRGPRVVVRLGSQMEARRAAIEVAATRLAAEVLPPEADMVPWMARARRVLTVPSARLYDLAFLGTPALVFERSVPFKAPDRVRPFTALGPASEWNAEGLARALERALSEPAAVFPLPGLGEGAARLAERLAPNQAANLAA